MVGEGLAPVSHNQAGVELLGLPESLNRFLVFELMERREAPKELLLGVGWLGDRRAWEEQEGERHDWPDRRQESEHERHGPTI